jgi:hypothetical protein
MRAILIIVLTGLAVSGCTAASTAGSTEATSQPEKTDPADAASGLDVGSIEGRWTGTGIDVERFEIELNIDKSSVLGRGAPVGNIRYDGKALRGVCNQSLVVLSVDDPIYTLYETGSDCPAGTVRLKLLSVGELAYTFDLGYGNPAPDATGSLKRVSQ